MSMHYQMWRAGARTALAALAAIALHACAAPEPRRTTQRLALKGMPSPEIRDAAEPFVTTDARGALVLSWLDRAADSSTAMRVAVLDTAGRWSAPADVVRGRDLFVNWADFPSVTTLANGTLVAHWLQKSGSDKYAYDIRLAASRDAGASWTATGLPHPAGVPVEHGFVSLLPRADSTADIVFLSGTQPPPGSPPHTEAPFHLSLARIGADGRVRDSVQTLDARTCTCCQTAAALTSRGPVVLYRDRGEAELRDISVVRQVNGAWTSPVPLHADGWIINACPVNGPAIAARGDTVVAVWFTNARDTARVQAVFSTDAGASFGAPVRIDQGAPVGRVDVELLAGGEALVTWIERTGEKSSEVRARLVTAAGGAEAPLTIDAPGAGRATGFPRMTPHAGGVALAWTVPGTPSRVRVATLSVAPR